MNDRETVKRVQKKMRGDGVSFIHKTRRRVSLSAVNSRVDGFSLIELVITITVMTILTMGVIPLVKVSVKRQKEQQLRDALRQMRTAIDEFHRDTVGMVCTGTALGPSGQPNPNPAANAFIDPRSNVVISDCTIFGVDNPDHYPPDLETLVNGVNITPRAGQGVGGRGLESTGTKPTDTASTLSSDLATKKKVYLRELPVDPITGKKDWDFKSCYDATDATTWGGENVFDVRSKSKERALNGEQYSDW